MFVFNSQMTMILTPSGRTSGARFALPKCSAVSSKSPQLLSPIHKQSGLRRSPGDSLSGSVHRVFLYFIVSVTCALAIRPSGSRPEMLFLMLPLSSLSVVLDSGGSEEKNSLQLPAPLIHSLFPKTIPKTNSKESGTFRSNPIFIKPHPPENPICLTVNK